MQCLGLILHKWYCTKCGTNIFWSKFRLKTTATVLFLLLCIGKVLPSLFSPVFVKSARWCIHCCLYLLRCDLFVDRLVILATTAKILVKTFYPSQWTTNDQCDYVYKYITADIMNTSHPTFQDKSFTKRRSNCHHRSLIVDRETSLKQKHQNSLTSSCDSSRNC